MFGNGAGDDSLPGGGGADTLNGGAGDDSLAAARGPTCSTAAWTQYRRPFGERRGGPSTLPPALARGSDAAGDTLVSIQRSDRFGGRRQPAWATPTPTGSSTAGRATIRCWAARAMTASMAAAATISSWAARGRCDRRRGGVDTASYAAERRGGDGLS